MRNNRQKRSDQFRQRKQRLRQPKKRNIIIFTDGQKTEINYIESLKKTIPENKKISVSIKYAKTEDLIEETKREALKYLNPPEKWIILDYDEVKNFNNLIKSAENSNINVAWTNPCIEVWFGNYFNENITESTSKGVLKRFRVLFKEKTNQNYQKNDSRIYEKLIKFGDEETAISLSENNLNSIPEYTPPEKQITCSTMSILVKRLKY